MRNDPSILQRSLLALWLLLVLVGRGHAAEPTRINGLPLTPEAQATLRQLIGGEVQPGSWWYDPVSGAFGRHGEATAGFLPAGLALGGPLRADASGGGDGRFGGVFINGRELHPQDIAGLRALIGQVIAGRYWVDGRGEFGVEGGGRLGNLWLLAQNSSAGPRGSAASGCSGAWCRHSRSWSGEGYFSDGKSGCIVMDGEISC